MQSYDVGIFARSDGAQLLFTVLEWLEGRSLAAALKAERFPWPLVRATAVLGPVAKALSVAHASASPTAT